MQAADSARPPPEDVTESSDRGWRFLDVKHRLVSVDVAGDGGHHQGALRAEDAEQAVDDGIGAAFDWADSAQRGVNEQIHAGLEAELA